MFEHVKVADDEPVTVQSLLSRITSLEWNLAATQQRLAETERFNKGLLKQLQKSQQVNA